MLHLKPVHRRYCFLLYCALVLSTQAYSLDTATDAIDASYPHHGLSQSNESGPSTFISRSLHLIGEAMRRNATTSSADHSLCAQVHEARDQCIWVQTNCADQDSGLLSYLQLYYCRLPQAKPVAMTFVLLWLAMLFVTIGITASDYFCVNLNTISGFLGLSESVAGVTLLAFGNGSPDVFSTWAAMSTGSNSLAIGELIGAAGFITSVVAGSMAIIRPFKVARYSFMRDLGFFIVAVAFTFGFLVDGHLQMWEVITMVSYYFFYGSVVIVGHWRTKKHKAKRLRDQLARQHFPVPEYTDNPRQDEEEGEDTELGASRQPDTEEEFRMLENDNEISAGNDDEDDDYVPDHQIAEITTSMRINRPRGVSRETTRNPIRPSLVGALEFRAILSSLGRSGNQLGIPLYRRRHSENTLMGMSPQTGLTRANSDMVPLRIPDLSDGEDEIDVPTSARPRAVSTNDIDNVRIQKQTAMYAHLVDSTSLNNEGSPSLPRLLIPVEEDNNGLLGNSIATSPALLSPASANKSIVFPENGSPGHSRPQSPKPQSLMLPDAHEDEGLSDRDHVRNREGDGGYMPYYDTPQRHRSRASSFQLPPAAIQPESNFLSRLSLRYWPHRFLPPPDELFTALFPTLSPWSEKNHLQKTLAVFTAPSIFLLNITLPVVEGFDRESKDEPTTSGKTGTPKPILRSNSQTPVIRTLDEHGQSQSISPPPTNSQDKSSATEDSQNWQRWLLCLQIALAPQLVLTLVWANLDDDHDAKSLLIGLSITLMLSFIMLAALLFTSTTASPPRYRPIFCILGFIVSISWISTIANEVVGVLKALGIILNISEAILGLTVFAVGSSLGDLVADITIARLGYPMMALSACFGGPMLNILLGIGLGGIYMLLQRGEKYHHIHPDLPIKYKSYHIHIDRTLVVSSIALLLTLIGLAIAVPLSGWRMTRRIGWALIVVWVIATIINLGVEIGGLKRS